MDQFLAQPGKSVHEVSLQDLFDMSRLTEQLPEHRALIGIEPETIDWGSQLTSDVNQSLSKAGNKVKQVLELWGVIDSPVQALNVKNICSTYPI